MDFPGLEDRLGQVRRSIADCQRRRGWSHPVEIVAVTKGHAAGAVLAAARAGLQVVGENRVQEALAKQEAVPGAPVRWHLVGTLQRNKVRQVIGRFELVHSMDRDDLALEWSRRLPAGDTQGVLVQVNCSREAQKGGVEPAELLPFLERLARLDGLVVRGLMTMTALEAGPEEQRRTFAELRTLRDQAVDRGLGGPELSMGMSDDYQVAVEEGATMVRLGTLLFGARNL